jgi:hypothetical protein
MSDFQKLFSAYLILTVLVVIKAQDSQQESKNETSAIFDCVIYNLEYSFEFLYDSSDVVYFDHSKSVPYTFPITKVLNYDRIRWYLIPKLNDTRFEIFNIKSFKSGKYLCSADIFVDSFKTRRKIMMSKKHFGRRCEWRLISFKARDFENDDSIINYIYNVEYEEPLYAASYFFKRDHLKRNIFLWHNKKEAKTSTKFNWMIDCKTSDKNESLKVNFNSK